MTAATETLQLNGVPVVDTFAEAFPVRGTRVVITAAAPRWAKISADEFCGFATSVIACKVEAAIERELSAEETIDGRPGISVLVFAFGRDDLAKAIADRVGQCVLTCPTTACYDGLPGSPKEDRIPVGAQLRYFGDGHQISKKLGSRRFWRIPVMDGEFVCEDRFGTIQGIGGGNLLIGAGNQNSALAAADAAATAMRKIPDTILPFPGGLVRSGSKVGSIYKKLSASTNDAYCPTLRAQTKTALDDQTAAVYEIVIDGFSFEAIQNSMRVGLHAAAASPGVTLLTAGNYGGKLGKHHFHLRDLL
ncbi:MAG: formylmethanofuran--tetrahydromethanopterin N-formyltransferase [Planctomycetota bacterium]|nr:formylmethanofuran--tetrahydromethanopterin N-formyltransferase [Planctomycetota bacterium]MDA1248968.1 formylmethanofuran--tetrahydromethanopterin N-formyltransferase [Planctomycetota bacterium]